MISKIKFKYYQLKHKIMYWCLNIRINKLAKVKPRFRFFRTYVARKRERNRPSRPHVTIIVP